MRIVSNLEGVGQCFDTSSATALLRLIWAAASADRVVIHFEMRQLVVLAIALKLLGSRCRIVAVDFFVRTPETMGRLRYWAAKQVDRYLVYFREIPKVARHCGLEERQFRYIPYKINGFELLPEFESSSDGGGYVFCGGRSRRDLTTLLDAIGTTGIPLLLVTSPESLSRRHGTHVPETVPSNVTLMATDPDLRTFMKLLAGCRLAVVPLMRGSLTQAGIAVYIQAMALGKCVVISEGLGVSDVLTEGQALIVPAGDVAALRNAIQSVWNDAALRERYARTGRDYALRLGGRENWVQSVLANLD